MKTLTTLAALSALFAAQQLSAQITGGIDFDSAGDLAGWQNVSGAPAASESSLVFDGGLGNPAGSMVISGTNPTIQGRAYLFQYDQAGVNFGGGSTATLTFDALITQPLVGAAFHVGIEAPGTGRLNTFDLQNQGLNNATWTPYTINLTGITGDGNFLVQFNLASGAFVGAGGGVAIDNVRLTTVPEPGTLSLLALAALGALAAGRLRRRI